MGFVTITNEDLGAALALAGSDPERQSAAGEALALAARDFDGRGTWEGYRNQRIRWFLNNLATKQKREASRLAKVPVDGVSVEMPINSLEILGIPVTDAEKDALLHADKRTKEFKQARAAVLARIEAAAAEVDPCWAA